MKNINVKSVSWLLSAILFLPTIIFAADTNTAINEVKQAYEAWCTAIGTAKGNPQEVVKYYAPDAILIPTLSGKLYTNKNGGLDNYFKKLTSLPDISCKTDKSKIRIHGEIATNSGFYTFSYINKNDHQESITARFTFVYKNIDNQWKIIKHHSSKTP
jgi:uncharacterized protein (TIGR02246 family)